MAAIGACPHVMAIHAQNDGNPLATHSLSPRELKNLLTAERLGKPFLAFRDQHDQLRLFTLGCERGVLTVGRRVETDLSIPWDGELSGVHAELEFLGGEWTILDDGLSTNGTFLNGGRVSGRQRLRDADLVRMGRTVFAYNAARDGAADKTAAAGERPAIPTLTGTQRRVLVALCRPVGEEGSFATPASNQRIADEVFLSVDAVKMHLRTLFSRFELSELPQNHKRARLAELALQFGVISQRELARDASVREHGRG